MPLADKNLIDNKHRLAALHNTNLINAASSPAFDRLTRLACRILNVPVSLVSLVEKDFQFFLSQVGLPEPYATSRRTPLTHSFCQHAVATQRPLVIANARDNALVYDNLAIDDLGVIAYLGIPLETSDGEAIGSFCAIDGIPRQWLDEEIEIMQDLALSVMTEVELRQELQARKVAERTLEVAIREREQIRLITEMTRSISHDCRNPIANIQMILELLAVEPDGDRRNAQIEKAQKSIHHIRQTLDDFTLIWTSSAVMDTPITSIDLNTIVKSTIQSLLNQSTMVDLNPNYRLELAEKLPTFMGQPLSIMLLIANLFENSVMHNPPETLVTIRTLLQDNHVMLVVADDGDGIPEEDLPHIFSPLYKVDKVRTPNSTGSGLGLTIVNHIVQQHHAKISVESKTKIGTSVAVEFPID